MPSRIFSALLGLIIQSKLALKPLLLLPCKNELRFAFSKIFFNSSKVNLVFNIDNNLLSVNCVHLTKLQQISLYKSIICCGCEEELDNLFNKDDEENFSF